MRPLERRLQSLENASKGGPHWLSQDCLSDAGLERLEQLVIGVEAGKLTIETMSDEDLAIIASIVITEGTALDEPA